MNNYYQPNRWEKKISERIEIEQVTTTTISDGKEEVSVHERTKKYVTFETLNATCIASYNGHVLDMHFSTWFSSDCPKLATDTAKGFCHRCDVKFDDPLVVEAVTWHERTEYLLVGQRWDEKLYNTTDKPTKETERKTIWSSRQLNEDNTDE